MGRCAEAVGGVNSVSAGAGAGTGVEVPRERRVRSARVSIAQAGLSAPDRERELPRLPTPSRNVARSSTNVTPTLRVESDRFHTAVSGRHRAR